MHRQLVQHVRLTWFEKIAIIEKAKLAPYMSYNELAQWARLELSLPAPPNKSTIGRVLKSSARLLRQPAETAIRKNALSDLRLALDENVVEFVMLAEAENVSITGAMIIHQAKELAAKMRISNDAKPRFGSSWLRCLQERYGFRWKRAFGESSSVDIEAANERVQQLRCAIGNYRLCDVFNMDESAFFYNAVPRGSICKHAAPALKQNKARVTMAVCANADGSEKLPILYLGTAAAPRWLPRKPATLQYFGTEKGWMTGWMYQQWLVGLDEKMRAQNRSILLLVDNASSHHETGLHLTNVRVEKLPPNTTAKIQPMDQGIINCIKRYVLNQKMQHALSFLGESVANPYTVDLLTALEWCEAAWCNVTSTTIENCWRHSGLLNKAGVGFLLN
jgi:hypothetical protein